MAIQLIPFLALLLTLTAFGCATTTDISNLPRIKVSYSKQTGDCTIALEHKGKVFNRTYKNRTHEDDYKTSLLITVVRDKLINKEPSDRNPASLEFSPFNRNDENANYTYQILGSCWNDHSGGVSVADEVWLEMWLPSSTLVHNGRSIQSGVTPQQLLNKGFTLSFSAAKGVLPDSNQPDVFVNEQLRLVPSFFFSPLLAEAGINVSCTFSRGGKVILVAGTFVVHPGTTGTIPINHVADGLRHYSVTIDQWEFDGVAYPGC